MAKTYTKTKWVNNETPLSETNLNNIEQGITDAIDASNINEISITILTQELRQHKLDYVDKVEEIEGAIDTTTSSLNESINTTANTLDLKINKCALKTDLNSLATKKEIEGLAKRTELFDKDYNSLTNKPTIPTVPTTLSSFTNDIGFITNDQIKLDNYFSKEETRNLIANQTHMSTKVVSELPTENISPTIIYLLKKPGTNTKEEYLYVDGAWELIGNTQVNVEGLVTEEQLASLVNSATANLVTSEQLTSSINTATANLVTNEQVDNKINSSIESAITGFTTTEQVDAKINLAINSLLTNKY
jgi:hypothetical protein